MANIQRLRAWAAADPMSRAITIGSRDNGGATVYAESKGKVRFEVSSGEAASVDEAAGKLIALLETFGEDVPSA